MPPVPPECPPTTQADRLDSRSEQRPLSLIISLATLYEDVAGSTPVTGSIPALTYRDASGVIGTWNAPCPQTTQTT
jgi:hypothetical protein